MGDGSWRRWISRRLPAKPIWVLPGLSDPRARSALLIVAVIATNTSCGPKLIQGVPALEQKKGEALAADERAKAAEALPILEPGKALIRWPQYDGFAPPVSLEGPRAWTVAPWPTGGGDCSFQAGITVSVETYLRVAGPQNVFKLDHWEGCQFAAPSALTMPLEKKPPKPGDVVLAELENGSQYGVVLRIKGDTLTYRVKKLLAKGTTDDVECKTDEVMVIGKQAKLGMPAAMRENGRYYLVTYLGGDDRSTWVSSSDARPRGIKVEAAAVRIISHDKSFKVGTPVIAARSGDLGETDHELEPGKITKTIDGVIYEVEFETSHGREFVPVENVSLPISG